MKPAHCQEAMRWLKDRGWNLAPLTGQDYAALLALSHCWQMWCRSDEDGRRAVVDAAAALLDGCQEVCWPMARELIAQAGDWSFRGQIWPLVVEAFQQRLERDGERVSASMHARDLAMCHYDNPLVHP